MPKSPLWAGPAKRRAMRWGECWKALETDKRGLPAFVVFPAFPQSGEKHRFALIFCALFDQAKSAGEQYVRMYIQLLTYSASPN
jgi:hypothetical protein